MSNLHRLGALLYAALGGWHVYLFNALRAAPDAAAEGASTPPSWAAWALAVAGGLGIVVALTLKWKSARGGYWLSLMLGGLGQVFVVLFGVVPGHLPMWPDGSVGVVLYVGAVVVTTRGLLGSGNIDPTKRDNALYW